MKMKFYKLLDNSVLALNDDGSQDSVITKDMVAITEEERKLLTAPLDMGPPPRVSMRQARLGLLAEGYLDTVEASVKTMPKASQIEWEFSTQVYRIDPLVVSLATTLNLDSAALDALFLSASKL